MFAHLDFFKRLLSRFAKHESGMTLPFLGLSFMAVVGFTGLAVDIARIQLVQARLSFALDAAGLAAGSTVNTTNLSTEVQKYTSINFPVGYMGATAPSTTATATEDKLIIDLTASTTVPMTFMNAFGISTVTVTADSQITRKTSGLELILVLDNTGSMSGSKLTALKTAATTLVNILYGNKTTVDKLWIGLVPFSQAVNIGTGYNDWMDPANTRYQTRDTWGWSGCVESRAGVNGTSQLDVTVDVPDLTKPETLFVPYYSTTSSDKNASCPKKIIPMTATKTTVLTAINGMTAVGYTHIPLGLTWGWRMLEPSWRGLWGSEMNTAGLPLDYGTEHMNKAIVLLTDGDNTAEYDAYTAYRRVSEGRIGGATTEGAAATKLDDKLKALCTTVKSKGIYLYTIALGSDVTTASQTMLKNCASAPNYYFKSPTTSQLNGVFSAIADSLSNLRVSK